LKARSLGKTPRFRDVLLNVVGLQVRWLIGMVEYYDKSSMLQLGGADRDALDESMVFRLEPQQIPRKLIYEENKPASTHISTEYEGKQDRAVSHDHRGTATASERPSLFSKPSRKASKHDEKKFEDHQKLRPKGHRSELNSSYRRNVQCRV